MQASEAAKAQHGEDFASMQASGEIGFAEVAAELACEETYASFAAWMQEPTP